MIIEENHINQLYIDYIMCIKLFDDLKLHLPTNNITLRFTNAERGYAKKSKSNGYSITIPYSIIKYFGYNIDIIRQYIIHELCHVYTLEYDNTNKHNKHFYRIFFKVCPKEYWWLEYNYKPSMVRHAKYFGYKIDVEQLKVDIDHNLIYK